MQALLVRDGRVSYERDFPKAEPGPGQALIRLLRAGICSTDIEIVKGYAAFEGILGHEFVGIVEYAADKLISFSSKPFGIATSNKTHACFIYFFNCSLCYIHLELKNDMETSIGQ